MVLEGRLAQKNYKSEKRRKELARQKKQEEKRKKRLEKKIQEEDTGTDSESGSITPDDPD
jgi:hypothetical protein